MNEPTTEKSLEQVVDEASKEPITAKDRVIGVVVSLALIGFCVAVWINPDLISNLTSDLSGKGGRTIRRLLTWINWAWSRPVGTVAAVIGVIVAWGAMTRKSPVPAAESATSETKGS